MAGDENEREAADTRLPEAVDGQRVDRLHPGNYTELRSKTFKWVRVTLLRPNWKSENALSDLQEIGTAYIRNTRKYPDAIVVDGVPFALYDTRAVPLKYHEVLWGQGHTEIPEGEKSL